MGQPHTAGTLSGVTTVGLTAGRRHGARMATAGLTAGRRHGARTAIGRMTEAVRVGGKTTGTGCPPPSACRRQAEWTNATEVHRPGRRPGRHLRGPTAEGSMKGTARRCPELATTETAGGVMVPRLAQRTARPFTATATIGSHHPEVRVPPPRHVGCSACPVCFWHVRGTLPCVGAGAAGERERERERGGGRKRESGGGGDDTKKAGGAGRRTLAHAHATCLVRVVCCHRGGCGPPSCERDCRNRALNGVRLELPLFVHCSGNPTG